MNSYLAAMSNYATFSGRATRTEYWMFTLVSTLISFGALGLDALIENSSRPGGVITGIVSLVHFIPAIAVFVRRMHDTDRSGWWYFLFLIPLVGAIVLIVFLCTRSTPGSNRFGSNPDSEVPIFEPGRTFAGR